MTTFSWDYVARTASDSLAEVGRSVAETIAQAVEPGLYLVEPDLIYQVCESDGEPSVLRNGVVVAGPGAEPTNDVLAAVAHEAANLAKASSSALYEVVEFEMVVTH